MTMQSTFPSLVLRVTLIALACGLQHHRGCDAWTLSSSPRSAGLGGRNFDQGATPRRTPGPRFGPGLRISGGGPALSSPTTTSLGVSIGLGPGEKKDSDEEEEAATTAVADPPSWILTEDDVDPLDNMSEEEAWTSRLTKLDSRCDEWFASLLGPSVTAESNDTPLPASITQSVHDALFHRVRPEETEDPVLDRERDGEEWTPYKGGRRAKADHPYRPPYGLENYGIPTPRRGAEAWRHFDVAGMVEVDYSGVVEGLGTDLILDDETTESYRSTLSAEGSWIEDDECLSRLVYIDGRYCPSLSVMPHTDDDGDCDTDRILTCNINARDGSDEAKAHLSRPDVVKFLQHLPDGFTDEIPSDEDDGEKEEKRRPRLISRLSGPDHKVGSPRSQFAINTQQGTAALAALNTLRAESVALIDIPANVTVDKPVLVLFAYTTDGREGNPADGDGSSRGKGVAYHPRVLVKAGKGSKATIVQSIVDLSAANSPATALLPKAPKMHNGYTQFYVQADAAITHSYVDESGGMVTRGVEEDGGGGEQISPRQVESERAAIADSHMECIDVHVTGEGGAYDGTVIGVGGSGRTRIALTTSLNERRCHAGVNGLMLSGGAQRGDIRTTIHHIEQGCTSQQSQKNMVGGRATATFKGRIRVEQEAQQTDSEQLSRTILLTDKCRIWAIPSLEIIADDVKCTHGATISDLSEEELFYLRSRGLDRSIARNLLMYAFVDEVGRTVEPTILGDEKKGLKKRIIDRLENLVPQGERAIMGEFQSV